MGTYFFRRVERNGRGPASLAKGKRYEVWQGKQAATTVTTSELDRLLDARRYPADFWAAVESADLAFSEGDHDSWIEFGSARKVRDPGIDD